MLRLADLPAGFVASPDTGRVSNAKAAEGAPPDFLAKLARWGRIGGYEAHFARRVTARTLQQGPFDIRSLASVYTSEQGAQATFAYASRFLVPSSYARLPVGFPLGQSAHEYVLATTSEVGQVLLYVLIWRERNVNAAITLIGRVGVVSAADLAPLARAQDRRILARLCSRRPARCERVQLPGRRGRA